MKLITQLIIDDNDLKNIHSRLNSNKGPTTDDLTYVSNEIRGLMHRAYKLGLDEKEKKSG